MFDAQSLTVPVGQEVQSSKEVENTSRNSRKAKVDSFVAKLEKDQNLQDSIRGRKYNYLFNDFGLPTVENQPIFVQLYKRSLKQFKDYPLSEDTWENICEDAVEKGVDIQESDKYSLGKDFYSYLYNAAIEDCAKIYEQETSDGVAESERKVRTLGNNIYYYADPQKFDELLTSIRNKLSDIATRQQLIDEIKQAKFNTDSKPVEPVIQQIDDIKKPFEKQVEPTENTDKTEVDSGESIQDKFKELDESPDQPEKPVDEPVKNSEITVEEQDKSSMKKSVIQDFLSSILKNKDKTKETQEPKQPEPVEDIDNKDETLESEDKQIDDSLSSEENKDINTETDNSNIEDLSDTDTEETDMNNKAKDSNVRFSAFGIDLTFEVPDFAIVSKTQEDIDRYLYENKYIPGSEDGAFRSVILRPDQKETNIVGMLNDGSAEEQNCWGKVSDLMVCWMMKNNLYGLTPEQREEDIIDKVTDKQWLKQLKTDNWGLNGGIFKIVLIKK